MSPLPHSRDVLPPFVSRWRSAYTVRAASPKHQQILTPCQRKSTTWFCASIPTQSTRLSYIDYAGASCCRHVQEIGPSPSALQPAQKHLAPASPRMRERTPLASRWDEVPLQTSPGRYGVFASPAPDSCAHVMLAMLMGCDTPRAPLTSCLAVPIAEVVGTGLVVPARQ